ncbi:hypothetical protein D3C80_1497570 [compost metagenome]
MNDLIISPLHEGGIHRKDRLHPFHSQRCAERCRVLLGNTDINHPVREFLREREEARAARHGRGYSNQTFILTAQLNQRLSEHFRIHRRLADRFQGLSGFNFVWRNGM